MFFQKIVNLFKSEKISSEIPEEVTYDAAWLFFERHEDQYIQSANFASKYLSNESVVVDVGANIGYFSYTLSKLNPNLKFYLFEPVPNLANHCRKTVEKFKLKAEVFETALSDQVGQFELFLARDGNIGWNTLEAKKKSKDMRALTINTIPFTNLNLDHADLIKIDVEGAEWRVLKGMLPWLQSRRKLPLLIIEIAWGSKHPHWNEELAQLNALIALGYRAMDYNMTPVELRQISATTDVVFIP